MPTRGSHSCADSVSSWLVPKANSGDNSLLFVWKPCNGEDGTQCSGFGCGRQFHWPLLFTVPWLSPEWQCHHDQSLQRLWQVHYWPQPCLALWLPGQGQGHMSGHAQNPGKQKLQEPFKSMARKPELTDKTFQIGVRNSKLSGDLAVFPGMQPCVWRNHHQITMSHDQRKNLGTRDWSGKTRLTQSSPFLLFPLSCVF